MQRLARETKVDVAKWPRQPSPINVTHATLSDGGRRQVPRLPRETKVAVAKCHACHAKCRWMQMVCDKDGERKMVDGV